MNQNQIRSWIKTLIKLNLSPTQYLYISAMINDNLTELMNAPSIQITEVELLDLQNRGILTLLNTTTLRISYNETNITLAKKLLDSADDTSWITEWLNLWPEGVKAGGYYVKSNEKGVRTKMKKFLTEYDFTPEVIINATKEFLEDVAHKGNKGIQCAHFFIEKNGVSNLATFCENYLKVPDHESRITSETGINV